MFLVATDCIVRFFWFGRHFLESESTSVFFAGTDLTGTLLEMLTLPLYFFLKVFSCSYRGFEPLPTREIAWFATGFGLWGQVAHVAAEALLREAHVTSYHGLVIQTPPEKVLLGFFGG